MATTERQKRKKYKSSIAHSQLFNVDLFGPQLPVLVAEAIGYHPGAKQNASVQLDPFTGWAWFVCQRKLFVWQLFNEEATQYQMVNCRELLLPPSDLAVTGDHVTIFVPPDSKTASCIAVTPDGLVRYWDIVSTYAPWNDVNTNLGGEEVSAVHCILPLGILAVTTSASMILITPSKTKGGTPTVNTHRISPRSWFSGISKKMNSILFGSIPNGQEESESKIVKVLTKKNSDDSWYIYLLAEMKLQFWIFSEGLNFDLEYDFDLRPLVQRALLGKEALLAEQTETEITILDINLVEGGIMVLAAVEEPRKYVLLHLACIDGQLPTEGFASCELSKKDISILEGSSNRVASLKFVLLPADALVFNSKIIIAVPMGNEPIDGDKIEIPGGHLNGYNLYNNNPIFFSATYGFVTIKPTETGTMDLLNRSCVEQTTSTKTVSSEMSVDSEAVYADTIRSAFTLYLRKNMVQCKQMLDKEFNDNDEGKKLGYTLFHMSLNLINSAPQHDPRWKKALPPIIGTASLHMETQLAEKQKAHDLFYQFVRDISVFKKVGKVTIAGIDIGAIHVINEHNEKIIATSIFRKYQSEHKIITRAINHSISSMNLSMNQACQDLFYRYISVVDFAIRSLVELTHEVADQSKSYYDVLNSVKASTAVICKIVYTIVESRDKIGFKPDPECPTWLSMPGETGIFDELLAMISLVHEFLENTDEKDGEFQLVAEQFFQLVDIILFLRADYHPEDVFEQLRDSLINCFYVKPVMYVRAKQLALKYRDFNHMINLVYLMKEDTKNLCDYMDRFGDEGFCDVLFHWLNRHHSLGDILACKVSEKWFLKLDNHLAPYPNLSWIHKFRQGKKKEAGDVLAKSALHDDHDIFVHERMLFMAKALYKTSDHKSIYDEQIEEQMHFMNVICCYPEIIESHSDLSIQNMTPMQFIEEIISKETVISCSISVKFEAAMEACLAIINQDKMISAMTYIIVEAILLDDWDTIKLDTDKGFDHVFFYKLLQNCLQSDFEQKLKGKVPPIEFILENERVKQINNNVAVEYVVRYAYERIFRITSAYSSSDVIP